MKANRNIIAALFVIVKKLQTTKMSFTKGMITETASCIPWITTQQ